MRSFKRSEAEHHCQAGLESEKNGGKEWEKSESCGEYPLCIAIYALVSLTSTTWQGCSLWTSDAWKKVTVRLAGVSVETYKNNEIISRAVKRLFTLVCARQQFFPRREYTRCLAQQCVCAGIARLLEQKDLYHFLNKLRNNRVKFRAFCGASFVSDCFLATYALHMRDMSRNNCLRTVRIITPSCAASRYSQLLRGNWEFWPWDHRHLQYIRLLV